MRVAVVHYHLRPGGVTRVIERSVQALRPHGIRVAVLSGEPGPAADAVVDGLGYASGSRWPDADPAACRAAARKALGGEPDLWHLHNHALGKNAALPRLASALARDGVPLLLQVHDFAEDGRPENHRRLRSALGAEGMAALYPLGPRVRYALLNRRDRGFLRAVGAPEAACLRLPNPVEAPRPDPAGADTDPRPLFLYPVRGIRRKNLGELLLWSALLRGQARFATTLPPENPEARPVYDRWKALARELDLDVAFECGAGEVPFSRLLGAAQAAITTSVAEGFGLAFLEPWGAGLPLAGRDLPEITSDFSAEGIDFDGLYPTLPVPAGWLDATSFRRRLTDALNKARAAYGLPCSSEDTDRALTAAGRDGRVDFGRLDEPMQEAVIRRVANTPAACDAWRPAGNPMEALQGQARSGRVSANAARVAQAFHPDRYGERLARIYRDLLAAPPGPARDALDPDALLRAFADPARFFLLRT